MPDSVPNYLTTDGNGLVTATFSGGVLMPLQANPDPQASSSVAWTDGPGGAKLAYVVGFKSGGVVRTLLEARSDEAVVPQQFAQFQTAVDTALNTASIQALARDSDSSSLTKVLIDSEERSDFLQVGSSLKSSLALLTFTWPGGAQRSNLLSLSGMLSVGVGPSHVLLTTNATHNLFYCTGAYGNPNCVAFAIDPGTGAPFSPAAGATQQMTALVSGP